MFNAFLSRNKRKILLNKIKKEGYPEKEVFVSLEDFFDGNTDNESIGVNIYPNPPSLKEFYETLLGIRQMDNTKSLLLRIADIDDQKWFYSDTVFISGNYTLTQIKKMFRNLKPDEIYEGFMYDKPSNIPKTEATKIYCIWWD
jgi:hypothetical protein